MPQPQVLRHGVHGRGAAWLRVPESSRTVATCKDVADMADMADMLFDASLQQLQLDPV